MNQAEILSALQKWVAGRVGDELPPDAPYLEAGLNSYDVMELTLFCEEKLGFQFERADYKSDDFKTLGGLAKLIGSRRAK